MKNVPLTGPSVAGYDVSHYQSPSIHEAMKAAGKKFCIIKADEGATFVDNLLFRHYKAAKDNGMKVGFYNFFHPAQNAHAQAKHILKTIGGLQDDIGAVCDLETTDHLGQAIVAGAAYQFLSDVRDAIGKAMLYGGPYFLRDTAQINSQFIEFPLWVAHYGPSPSRGPLVPEPYTNWTFWQFRETGGIDLNLFNGDEEALNKFCAR